MKFLLKKNYYRLIRCLHLQLHSNINMSQRKISTFFQSPTVQKKRKLGSDNSDKDKKAATATAATTIEDCADQLTGKCIEPHDKIRKSSEETDVNVKENNITSPEKRRIEDNKLAAKLKLLSNKTNGVVVNIGPSWFNALEPEFTKDYFSKLSQFITAERKSATVYPPPEQVFTWTTACALRSVKVVIIGQDPYHGPKQAHGLCFSVLPGVKPPPSLENMFKELESDIPGFKAPGHGNLIGWAKQGVLLLNACLTVRAGQPNSHAGKGWEKLTDATIQWINSNLSDIVFLLWGAYAQKKGACINKKKHHILATVHPSPLSAHRGFFGCKHFSKCNELLIANGHIPIDWKDLPEKIEL